MEKQIYELLRHILECIQEQGLSINLEPLGGGYEEMMPPPKEQVSLMPLLANNLYGYLQDNHPTLEKEINHALMLCDNGDLLIQTSDKGLGYYKDNKEQLYSEINLKSGADNIYVYSVENGECWVQYEPDLMIKNIGQAKQFGTRTPLTTEESMFEEDDEQGFKETLSDKITEMMDTPVVSIEGLAAALPEPMASITLTANDVAGILHILQTRLTYMTFNNINQLINENPKTNHRSKDGED